MQAESHPKAPSSVVETPNPLNQRLLDLMRLLAGNGDPLIFLTQVAVAARDLTHSEAGLILRLDEGSQPLAVVAASPEYEPVQAPTGITMEQDAAARAIAERRPIVVTRAADLSERSPASDDHSSNKRSVLATPLIARGKALGALLAVNRGGSDYTGEDSGILETLAAPAALAIDHAALRRRLEHGSTASSDLDRMKSDFIAITSHELRTPLGLILGHATFLRELLGDEYREQLDVVIKNASRLKDIVESLSSMDNFKTGGARLRLQEFSLQELAAEVLDSYADMAAKRGVELKVEGGSADLAVEGDRTKIAIALANLVRNGIAFTDAGGHVLVRCEPLQEFAKVSVIDSGVGIPAKDLAHVFDRFFQVESHLTRHHTGMGLGLSVTKAMIEMHGGRIWVESIEGKGSEFSFLLPRKSGESATAGTVPR